MYTLLYSKWVTNTDSTWNSTQGYVPDWIGSGFGGECAALSRSVVSDSVTPIDCSPPGSSAHGILQVRILEWAAISFSRDLPNPGMEPRSPAWQTLYQLSHQRSPRCKWGEGQTWWGGGGWRLTRLGGVCRSPRGGQPCLNSVCKLYDFQL